MLNNIFTHSKSADSLCASSLYSNDTFYSAFERDLRRARRRVVIESPFITSRRMNHLYPVLMKLKTQGVRIVINTRNPQEHNDEYRIQATTAIELMQAMGISVLFTVKHHRKLAIIDDHILWEGSLNILSQNDSCEMMRRSQSSQLVDQMVKFIGVRQYF